jgi:hypothetical protein
MSRLPFLSRGKLHVVETDNANTKRLIGQYWGDAVAHFRATGTRPGLTGIGTERSRGTRSRSIRR